jgi:transposase
MSNKKLKTYTLEFKQASAKLAAESEQSVSETARELGIGVSTLHSWIQKHYSSKKAMPKVLSDPQEEIKALKKELARVKEERDILKKATAYFANETR